MANETRRHISELLLSNRKHAKYVGILACLAVVVVFGVAMGLRQNGRAATHEEQVLDCHYSGNGAHTHDESCYDKDGNLVCPLPERELHTHTDACYSTEERLVCDKEEYEGHIHTDDCYDEEGNLICGLEEYTGHEHTDDCYDEDGNLICGLEEREVHTHTDDCYETVKTLTCDKEEVTEEHVHGPGCFKTITVVDSEEEETEAEPEVAYPAQEFKKSLKQRNEDGEEYVALTVSVQAPEGALPEGTEMKVSGIASDEVDDVEAKVDAAVKRTNGENFQVKQWQAVDINFFDKDGNEIEPKKHVEVKITSEKVSEIESPVLVHVIDKDKDSAKGKDVDAEVLEKVSVINEDENDKSEGNEDTLKFKSDEFSPYVIVEVEELYAEYLSSNGSTYEVKVNADGDACIPSDASLSVKELNETSRAYMLAYDAVVEQKLLDDPTFSEDQFGMVAVDISILDGAGDIFEPSAPVMVSIKMKSLPQDVDSEVLQNTLEVQHLDTSSGVTVVETVANVDDGVQVGSSSATAEFVVDSFSTFTISWTGDSEGSAVGVPDSQAKAILNVQKDGATYAKVNVHYLDSQGHSINNPFANAVNSATPVTIDGLLNPVIEGYTYVGARYGAANGEAINTITVTRDTQAPTGPTYTHLGKTDSNGRIGGSEEEPSGDYTAYYKDQNGTQRIYWNNKAFRETNKWNGKACNDKDVYGYIAGGETSYIYTLSFDNEAITPLTSDTLTGSWDNAADIYLVYKSGDTEIKHATIHFGTVNTANGKFEELQKSVSLDTSASTISLDKAMSGYQYVGAYYCAEETQTPSAGNNEITSTLKKTDDNVWVYRNASTAEQGTLVNESHIYVSYVQKNGPSGTSTPAGNNEIPTPSTIKKVTSNGDGTYDIQLDIIGKQIVESERKGANVLLIFDRTSSMSKTMEGGVTRIAAAKSAVRTLVAALDPAKNPVKIALFTFDRHANEPLTANGSNWLTDGSTITSYTDNLDLALDGSHAGCGGTNWEAALDKAKQVLATADSDPTYVIFLTDGNPSWDETRTSGSPTDPATEQSQCYTRAAAKALELGTNYKIYGVLSAKASDGPLLQTLVNHMNNNGYDATHVLANDSATLTNTFQNIADYIVNQLAASEVATNDGITELSTVNAAFSGAAGAFKYYTAREVKQENGKYYYYTYSDDGEIVKTEVPANQVETYEYQDQDGHPKSYLYYNREKWNSAPGASYSEESGVTWDLGSEGALTGGRIYTVRFTIWPSQDAYDLLADLNNHIKAYNAGQENSITEAERNQVYESGGVYYLKTNTTLDTSYQFAGNEYSDNIPYYQGAMNLDSEKISLQKLWPENLLDDYEEGRSDTGIKDNITLTVTKDGENYLDVTLNKDKRWKDEDVCISCGLMTIDEDGKIDIKETGHDYTVIEPVSFSYYWDLIADIYHPMVINGVKTLLVLDEGATTADNVNSFKLNGKVYKKQATSSNTLEAYNYRRANLNLTKVVNGINVPEDAYFTFKLTVTDAGDDKVWFSAFDSNGVVKADGIVDGANKEIKDGQFSGFYYANSGDEVTIRIKAGWNVRFLNLLHGSTFSFEEVDLADGYSLDGISATTKYALDGWYEIDDSKIEGSIAKPNNQYSVTYANNWDTVDVQLKKVDDANQAKTLSGSEFNLSYRNADDMSWVQVNSDLDKIKPGYIDPENPENNTSNPLNLGGIGVGWYKLTEVKAPDGYIILKNDIFFEVYKENDEFKVTLTNANGARIASAEKASVTSEIVDGKTIYTIIIGNTAGQALPMTGGMGTMPFTILGTAIVIFAILTYGLISRRTSGRRSMR